MISGNYTAVQNHKTIQRKQQPGFSSVGVHDSLKITEIGKALAGALNMDYYSINHLHEVTDRKGWHVEIGKDLIEGVKGYCLKFTNKAYPEAAPQIVPFNDGNKKMESFFREISKVNKNPISVAKEYLKSTSAIDEIFGENLDITT